MNNVGDISFGEGIPAAALRSQYITVPIESTAAPAHACRIVLPTSAVLVRNPEPGAPTDEQLSLIANFSIAPSISVQLLGATIPFEINLVEWLQMEVEERGIPLSAVQSAVDGNGQVAHAVVEDVARRHVRIVARTNGPHILVLLGQSPEADDAETHQMLGLIAASLQLTSPLGEKLMEPLSAYHDPAGYFQTMHPSSWKAAVVATPRALLSAADIRLTSDSDTIAYLRIEADRTPKSLGEGSEAIFRRMAEELVESVHIVKDGSPRRNLFSGQPI